MNKISWLIVASFYVPGVWADPNGQPVGSTPAVIGQTLLGLFIVIVAIYLLAWVTKKLNGHTPQGAHGLKLLGCLPLGPKEKAVLVEAAGKKILLGVTAGSVNTLHVYEEKNIDHQGEMQYSGDESEPEQSGVLDRLAARSSSEFTKKLNTFLGQGNRTQ